MNMERQNHTHDILIVGGGLAGASLALAIADLPLNVALLEANPPDSSCTAENDRDEDAWDTRIYAISRANSKFLTQIGVWQQLDNSRVTQIRAMHTFGDQGGRLDFSAFECGLNELGFILESSLISNELWAQLRRQRNLCLYCPAHPVMLRLPSQYHASAINNDLHVEEGDIPLAAAQLDLDDGSTLSARLVVGADGRESWLRKQAGLATHSIQYGDSGVVANFACEQPHHNVAHQWFGVNGVLAWLPLPGQRISIVWSTPSEHAERLQALSADEMTSEVAKAGNHALGDLHLLTKAQAFPLKLIRVPDIIAPRLALIGDAAHGIHPLSGHGINLGFQDAYDLARLICNDNNADPGAARLLRSYKRCRREETLLMQSVTDGLYHLFNSHLPGLPLARNLGMHLTNRLGLLKTFLARYATEGL